MEKSSPYSFFKNALEWLWSSAILNARIDESISTTT